MLRPPCSVFFFFFLFQAICIPCSFQSIALFTWCDVHVLCCGILNEVGLESHLLVCAGDVFEREVFESVLVALAYVKEIVAVHLDVLDGDVVALAQRHVFSLAWFEELGPWAYHQEAASCALYVIHCHILIVLGGVWTHFQPKYSLGVPHLDVAEHNITVFHALAAQSEASVYPAVVAVLDEYVIDGTVFWGLVSPRALSALDGDGIIVDAHVAVFHQDVMADVDVDGITAGCLHATGGGEDGATQEADMVAAVDVVSPERTVLDMDILYGHIAGVADIDEAGTLCVLVGALAVPSAANPELLPVVVAIAVDGARTCDGEAVAFVGIDEGGEILAGFALDASLQHREVGDAVAALQFSTFL